MYLSSFDPLHLSQKGQNIRMILMNGGLGNQTFQYIFARWLELKTGEPCYINDIGFMSERAAHNGYELDKVFDVHPRLLTKHLTPSQKEEIFWYTQRGVSVPDILRDMGYQLSLIAETIDFSFKGNVTWTPTNEYNQYLALAQGFIYYHGYFINVNWFKDIITNMLEELSFVPIPDEKNKEYARQIEETNSVAVHFRTKHLFATDWKIPEEMYAKAVEVLEEGREKAGEEEYTYFVFTDGPEYVQEHYKEAGLDGKNLVFVEGNVEPNNYIDCQLMTLCKHRIVTNSSFDYLAALIRKNRGGRWVNLAPSRGIV